MTSSNLTYGLASRDRIAAMTGKQILQAIIEGEFPQAPISRALTFWIVEVGDGFAAFEGGQGRICSTLWEPCTGLGADTDR